MNNRFPSVRPESNISSNAGGDYIESNYTYEHSIARPESDGTIRASTELVPMLIRTSTKLAERLGVLVVGIGGNNGSTLVSMHFANKNRCRWRTRNGLQQANYIGSLTQCGTLFVGSNPETNEPVYAPFSSFLPIISADNIVFGGWDISGSNLFEAAKRAHVLDPEMIDTVEEDLKSIWPMKAVFDLRFVNANQRERCDNLKIGDNKSLVEQVRADIRNFKTQNKLDQVIVVWMANTERFCDVRPNLNLTETELMNSVDKNEDEISPSTLYGIASVLEGCAYINGSPQNTFVPGLIALAERLDVPVVGDDLKTGQTKIKSVLVDFLVSAGMKPLSIVSYNHLGNNDGLNLSATEQFRSKEITKSSVVSDAIASNRILYPIDGKSESPNKKSIDHCIVIKYVEAVGDSKRAMDEYFTEIACGGRHTLAIHNTCEDSLLAAPLILDLILLTELFSRMSFSLDQGNSWSKMHPVFSVLSYLCKAPLVPQNTPVVNALFSQRACIENIIRAAIGLRPVNHMMLESKIVEMGKMTVGPTQQTNGVANGN